jgi:adenine-specific DNA-methyltransferase
MNEKKLTPKKALNKAFLKMRPARSEIEAFKSNLVELLDRSNDHESEEFHKNLAADFLKKTYYGQTNFINTKGRNDLVIHLGPNAQDHVGIIIEAKKPTNTAEMPSQSTLNSKGFQELVWYYMRERFISKNIEIKYLICTNIYEWFIFDAIFFERHFAQDIFFVNQFKEFVKKGLVDTRTPFFYREIAAPAIKAIESEIEYTYFDIRDYEQALRSDSQNDDAQLISLFKLLSPKHLLKQQINNDSNRLDKGFYTELLHIIGLVEVQVGGKELIVRRTGKERDSGSLVENAMYQIDALEKLERIQNFKNYGLTRDDQLFNVSLELSITWINRILFLKLLEAQLLAFHKGDKDLAFLNSEKVKSFAGLNELFFEVLARRPADRDPEIQRQFPRVPYLNSSLFEPTELEHEAIPISNLSGDRKIRVLKTTVLKDSSGEKLKGYLSPLQYILDFLSAFDFSADTAGQIQEENKRLINASVLGLIFEKINGYKDGSFFTPGFVTMHMCRETIRKAAIQKFNEVKNWDCKSVEDLYEKITDKKEANTIINSLRICDPAVGSGHFLVSALNEIISLKNDLLVLLDRSGKRLKEYQIEVIGDELIVSDEDGELLEYKPASKESQRIQEALFHEKQTVIENCLFGVDINQNSVKICRLRLWIELLKNAYYDANGNLETLPNIDINIKKGNSTISRFGLEEDLKSALKKSGRTLKDYQLAVSTYRDAKSKSEKRKMEQLIDETKKSFRQEIQNNDPVVRRLNTSRDKFNARKGQQSLFEESAKEKATRKAELESLRIAIEKLEKQIEAIKISKIYEDAFEWRFEFPEVLDDGGEFVGFDAVIANPPYIDSEKMLNDGHGDIRQHLTETYSCAKGNWDLYIVFMELGLKLLKQTGTMTFITPDKWISKPFGNEFRMQHIGGIETVVMLGRDVFESAIVDSIITQVSKLPTTNISTAAFQGGSLIQLNQVSKTEIEPPYFLDPLLSVHYDFVCKLDKKHGRIRDIIQCESACATADAYKLKPFVADITAKFNAKKQYLVVNTGTLGKYVSRWGMKPMTYLKSKYLRPMVSRDDFAAYFTNTYKLKSDAKKIIVKGLTLLDATLDLRGEMIPGKTTLVLTSQDDDVLKYVSAILNSPIAIFYVKAKYGSASYNGGVTFTKDMINSIPLPLSRKKMRPIIVAVEKILQRKEENHSADIEKYERAINDHLYQLYELSPSEIAMIEGADSTLPTVEAEEMVE